MVNIAVCGDIAQGAGVDALAAQCARTLDIATPAVHPFANAFELLEHLDTPSAEPLFDLLAVRADGSGMSGIQIARDARKSGFAGEILLVEESDAHALEAQRLDVRAYLVAPASADDLGRAFSPLLARLAEIDAESVTMRLRDGIRRVMFPRLVFSQTANHDQVLHMRDGQTMQLRCSSQDLFDRLSHDARFLKLGSSYIVNLDQVSALNANAGTLSFVEGSVVPVPVRLRKTAQDALYARAEWRKHA